VSDRAALVLGGSGFVGRHLVARLVAAGWRVIVPTRRRERAKHLILLPTVDVVEADVHNEGVLTRLTRRAPVVVNLVGILHESRRGEFDRVHVELARKLVAACRAAGVTRLLHMSAQNADPRGPSRYLRSKGEAEAIVSASDLAWTVFRPSVIFGREDSFLNLFAAIEKFAPFVPLACADAKFQPVYVGDVARAFQAAADDDSALRQRFALCGPKVYTLRELVRYVGQLTGHNRPILPLGGGLATLQARVLEWLPGPLMSRDNLASMTKDSVCDGSMSTGFAFEPTALEAAAPGYLSAGAIKSRYDEFRAQSGR
jgi:NADH dehydrogenase